MKTEALLRQITAQLQLRSGIAVKVAQNENVQDLVGLDYAGAGQKVVSVNPTETGLVLVDAPVGTTTPALQAALDAKLDDSQAGAFGLQLLALATLAAAKVLLAYTKGDIALGNVDNTSDANKPVSTAQQAALDLKLNIAAYTAADVLAKLLTVDGAGSGLDADLLDAQSGAFYLGRANHTGTQLAATISDLGTAAIVNTGTSGATIPLLNGANTNSGFNDFSAGFRSTGTTTPGSGAGIEVVYTGAEGRLNAFDRGAAAWKPLLLRGSTVELVVNGTSITQATGTGLEPSANNSLYLGRNDDDSPKAWRGLILADQVDGKIYRLQSASGVVQLVDLTD